MFLLNTNNNIYLISSRFKTEKVNNNENIIEGNIEEEKNDENERDG